MFFLLIRDGGREPAKRIEATNGMDIGRAPDNQCLLADPNVGRKAARIVEASGVFYLEDLGSVNPTSIRGGRKLAKGQREPLRHGMVIEVGRSSIEVEEEAASDATGFEDATSPDEITGADLPDRTPYGDDVFDRTMPGNIPLPPPRHEQEPDPLVTLVGPSAKEPPQRATPPAPKAALKRPQAPAPKASLERSAAAAPKASLERGAPAAARAVPKPVPIEEPPPASGSSTADFSDAAAVSGTMGGGTQSIRPMSGDLGAIGALITRRARLVIVNEAIRRIDKIEKPVVTVGREQGEIRIDHRAISQPHSTIRFIDATMNFQIEDRRSKNQTFVGGLALTPDVPQLLAPECLVRFGPIEAIFVVDRDCENAVIPPEHYAGAVRHLVAQKQITQEQARVAQEEAKSGEKHVGEALMMSGAVSGRAWTKAFEQGKVLHHAAPSAGGGRTLKLVIGLVLLVAVLVLGWIFRAKLGLGGS